MLRSPRTIAAPRDNMARTHEKLLTEVAACRAGENAPDLDAQLGRAGRDCAAERGGMQKPSRATHKLAFAGQRYI